MRRVTQKLLALLILAFSMASAQTLKFSVYPPKNTVVGESVTFTILMENTGKKAAKYNIYTCPQLKITSQWTRKTVQGINACIEPLTDVVIPPGGRYIQTVNYGKPLAFGPYKAFISLNDTTNSHKATLTTLFTVEQPPQVVQQVIMPPVVLSEKPLVVQVKTLNISSRVFSQDLRLCYTDFVIRDKRQQVVYETPSTQVCTADLQVTSVKPGASFTANWRLDVTLKPGTYEIQHKSFWGTPLTTFEVR